MTATSDGGEVTSTVAVVTVEAGQRDQEPTLPEMPKVVSVKEGEDIEISCTIAGLVMSVVLLFCMCSHGIMWTFICKVNVRVFHWFYLLKTRNIRYCFILI